MCENHKIFPRRSVDDYRPLVSNFQFLLCNDQSLMDSAWPISTEKSIKKLSYKNKAIMLSIKLIITSRELLMRQYQFVGF